MSHPSPNPGAHSSTHPGAAAAGHRAVILVSGLSGAGKASILRSLEDIGYEAVDNPPLTMVEELVSAAGRDPGRRLAIGIDTRTRGFDAASVLSSLARLRAKNPRLELVFAWAEDDVLQRRFTQTRRRHPLAGEGRVGDGIAIERTMTAPLREQADLVIDTTNLPLPTLRRLIEDRFGGSPAEGRDRLSVTLMSFAFPAGLPRDADMVFDARFLANPHYVDSLRELTGFDAAVAAFVEADADFPSYYQKLAELVAFVLPRFVREGKKYVTIAVGCTGGRHRSVFIVRRLATMLGSEGWRVASIHRELPEADPAAKADPGAGPALRQPHMLGMSA